jgi:hypothetical protein
MKRYIYISMLITLVFAFGCEYEEIEVANPLDAPAFLLSAEKTEITTGETIQLSIQVTDAPGRIDSVAISTSNDFGTIAIDESSLSAARGNTTGDIDFTFTAPETNVGVITITVVVFDQQNYLVNAQAVEPQSKSTSSTIDIEVDYLSDGPIFTVSTEEDTLLSNGTTNVTIDITSVPGGGIDEILALAGAGSIELDEQSVNDAIGKSSAVVTGVYSAGEALATGEVDITVTVIDQAQRRASTISTDILVICPSAEDISGTYDVFANGVLGDGTEYEALQTTVTITKLNDGQFAIDDMSFGVYPELYSDDAPEGTLNICGTVISDNGDTDQYGDPFTINGSLPDPAVINGTIRITWSNTFGDSGEVFLTKQ